jgi:hypothetical protein
MLGPPILLSTNKVQKPNSSDCCRPSSELFRFWRYNQNEIRRTNCRVNRMKAALQSPVRINAGSGFLTGGGCVCDLSNVGPCSRQKLDVSEEHIATIFTVPLRLRPALRCRAPSVCHLILISYLA